MITKDSIETAYSFLHQKRNVYIHSTLDWQKDPMAGLISLETTSGLERILLKQSND